jgi:hypothetical protein
MDAPVYKKLTDIENQRENPFHTKHGQDVVSISENFWARISREGRWRSYSVDKVAFATTTSWLWNWATQAEPDSRWYPKTAILSADVDCQLGIKVLTGTSKNNAIILSAFVKAGTPLVIPFDGELWADDNNIGQSGIYFGVNNATTGGNLYASVQGIEVTI